MKNHNTIQSRTLSAIAGRAVHPCSVGYSSRITWIGEVGLIDYSCPSGPGPVRVKAIGVIDGRVVCGQLADGCTVTHHGDEAILCELIRLASPIQKNTWGDWSIEECLNRTLRDAER